MEGGNRLGSMRLRSHAHIFHRGCAGHCKRDSRAVGIIVQSGSHAICAGAFIGIRIVGRAVNYISIQARPVQVGGIGERLSWTDAIGDCSADFDLDTTPRIVRDIETAPGRGTQGPARGVIPAQREIRGSYQTGRICHRRDDRVIDRRSAAGHTQWQRIAQGHIVGVGFTGCIVSNRQRELNRVARISGCWAGCLSNIEDRLDDRHIFS